MKISFYFFIVYSVFTSVISTDITPGREHTVMGFIGDAAVLPCDVDMVSCGKIYFITWSKNVSNEWRREFLYSEGVAEAMGDFATPDRATFFVGNNSASLRLDILTVKDEGTYKCDVTYVQGKCPSLSFIHLYTLITPSEPSLELESKPVENSTTVGPYKEGSTFTLDCKSKGGRPPPHIEWRNSSRILPSKTSITPEGTGTFFVTSTTRFVLSRWDLGSRLECHVFSNATVKPQVKWARLDVHVRPNTLNVRGPVTPVVAGEMVSLTCTIEGARPAANTTWYNRSEIIRPQPQSTKDLMSDGTYRTTSTLVFVASRHDHLGEFFCKGTNEVLTKRLEAPLLQATTLEVLYPPAVMIEPDGMFTAHEGTTANLSCPYKANPRDVTEIVWYKDGVYLTQSLNVRGKPKPFLVLRNMSRQDAGVYTCHVKNAFGRGNSSNSAVLSVLYPQIVRVSISQNVISEGDTVSMECFAVDGNPKDFTAVRWYRNEELISETAYPVLNLEGASKRDGGLYSCEGLNAAGWSEISTPEDLLVKYSPGLSTITQIEPVAIKGRTVSFECNIEDSGYPPASVYRWEHLGKLLNATSKIYTTEPVKVHTQGNYSCSALNEVGRGPPSFLQLNAVAPPSFVKRLPSMGGVSRESAIAELSCHVECDPLCELEWLRNNETIKELEFFNVLSLKHSEDLDSNTFSSIASTLRWNISHLMPSSFDYNTFTCRSTPNELGTGVSSSTTFRVEYPPENIQISSSQIEILEGEIPGDLICSASAHPRAQYTWKTGERTISQGPVLSFNGTLSRKMGGNYSCIVVNRHGSARADVIISVLHRPECLVVKEFTREGKVHLTCIVYANPPIYDITWHKNNVSINSPKGFSSVLAVPPEEPYNYGRYSCVATNELGTSDPCFLELSPIPAPSGWVQMLFQEENLLIFAAIVGGVGVLLVLILILVIAVVMKRRYRATAKGNLDIRQSGEGREMVGEGTPLGTSPLLSGLRADGGPLLQKNVPDCGYLPRIYGEKRPLNLLNGREEVG